MLALIKNRVASVKTTRGSLTTTGYDGSGLIVHRSCLWVQKPIPHRRICQS